MMWGKKNNKYRKTYPIQRKKYKILRISIILAQTLSWGFQNGLQWMGSKLMELCGNTYVKLYSFIFFYRNYFSFFSTSLRVVESVTWASFIPGRGGAVLGPCICLSFSGFKLIPKYFQKFCTALCFIFPQCSGKNSENKKYPLGLHQKELKS